MKEKTLIESSHSQNEVKQFSTLSGKRNGFVDLCRFIFMFGIVSHHAMYLTQPGHIPIWGGYVATDFFFMLTGYFLFQSAQKDDTESGNSAILLVYKKFRKIYPYFFLCYICSFIMWHIANDAMNLKALTSNFAKGLPQLLFLEHAGLTGLNDGVYQYIGTMWYISASFAGILVIYPLMRSCKRYFATAIAPVLALFCYGYIMMRNHGIGMVLDWLGFFLGGNLRAVAGLCLGAFLSYLVKLIPAHTLTRMGQIVVVLVQVGCIGMSLALMEYTVGYTDVIQLIIFSVLIVVAFAEQTNSCLNKICDRKICYFLGKFSMVMFPAQCLAFNYPQLLPYPTYWPLRYLFYIGYVLLFSFVCFILVEGCGRLKIWHKLKKLLWERTESTTA